MKFSTALAPRGSRPGGSGSARDPSGDVHGQGTPAGPRPHRQGATARTAATASRQGRAPEQAVDLQGLDGVGAAGRVEAARRRQRGRDPALVAAHQGDERPRARRRRRSGPGDRRPSPCRSRPSSGPAQDRPKAGVEVVAQDGRRRLAAGGNARTTRRGPGGRSPGAGGPGGAAAGRRGVARPSPRRPGSPRNPRAAERRRGRGRRQAPRDGRPVEGGRRVGPGARPRRTRPGG